MKASTSSTRTNSGLLHAGPRGYRSLLVLFVFLLPAAFGLLGLVQGCAPKRPPAPVTISVCPPIPLPLRPVMPKVILPAPDAQGRYCLTEKQTQNLMRGIRDLQTYADQLEAAIKVYNAQAATADRR